MSIFSKYSQGENRVTASCLAVFRSLPVDRVQRLLGAILEKPEFEFVRFRNQPAKNSESIPDAEIQSSFRLLIEAKVARKAVKLAQVKSHLQQLDASNESVQRLLVLTPDEVEPTELASIDEDRLVWASFGRFDQAIDELLRDEYEVVSEREEFLLRELQAMFEAEGLLASEHDVVVVAARDAWDEYLELNAYVCQPNRTFKDVRRMGFYRRGEVCPLFPSIDGNRYPNVEIRKGVHQGALGVLVDRLIDEKRRPVGSYNQVILLTAPESKDTLRLNSPIPNTKQSKSGKPTAFTMGQRYIKSASLLSAKTTQDLE